MKIRRISWVVGCRLRSEALRDKLKYDDKTEMVYKILNLNSKCPFNCTSDVLTKSCAVGIHVGESFTKAVGKQFWNIDNLILINFNIWFLGLTTFYAANTTQALNLQDCLFKCVALPNCDILEFQVQGNLPAGYRNHVSASFITFVFLPVFCTIRIFFCLISALIGHKLLFLTCYC